MIAGFSFPQSILSIFKIKNKLIIQFQKPLLICIYRIIRVMWVIADINVLLVSHVILYYGSALRYVLDGI